MTAADAPAPAVIRISPMAHFAPAFLALALLTLLPALGNWSLSLMAVPVLISVAIVRLRTTADGEAVTARTLVASRTAPWGEVEGLRFSRGGWARACLRGGRELTLPAVTFATLPRLAAASGGRVPNPYGGADPGGSGEGVGAVQQEPGRDSPGDTEDQSEQ